MFMKFYELGPPFTKTIGLVVLHSKKNYLGENKP